MPRAALQVTHDGLDFYVILYWEGIFNTTCNVVSECIATRNSQQNSVSTVEADIWIAQPLHKSKMDMPACFNCPNNWAACLSDIQPDLALFAWLDPKKQVTVKAQPYSNCKFILAGKNVND